MAMAGRKLKHNIGIFVVAMCLFCSCIYFYENHICPRHGHCSPESFVERIVVVESKIVNQEDQEGDSTSTRGGYSSGYYFQECNCTKHQNYLTRLVMSPLASQCSEESDWYGHGQRVISYTLYNGTKTANDGRGDSFKMFSDGILPNLEQMRKFYPGWIMRLYSNCELTKEYCQYACMDDVMWCDVRSSRFNRLDNVNPRIWRFMTMGDPTVDIFLSRDMDSLINEREREAVEEFENSPFAIHCARDGRNFAREMSAGSWGAKNFNLDAKEIVSVRDAMMKKGVNNTRAILDEDLLRDLVFYKYNNTVLCHDSYSCKKYRVPSVPFPKQRNSTRVALEIRNKKYKPEPCPKECRPSYGQNWTYC